MRGPTICDFSYPAQHAIFVLLHLGFSWLAVATRHDPLHLASVTAVIYHALMGAACASPQASAAIHGFWGFTALAQGRMIFVWTFCLSLAWVASQCVSPGSARSTRIARLAVVNAPLLAAVCLIWCMLWSGWRSEGSTDHIFPQMAMALSILMTFNTLQQLCSNLFSIYAATRSKAVLRSAYLNCLLLISAALIRRCFHLDPADGGILPHSSADRSRSCMLVDMVFVSLQAAGHAAIDHSHLQSALSRPFSTCASFLSPKIPVTMWHISVWGIPMLGVLILGWMGIPDPVARRRMCTLALLNVAKHACLGTAHEISWAWPRSSGVSYCGAILV